MPEPNENQTTIPPNQEICTIRIVFPVESDEQAIDFKKKISTLLKDIPDSGIQFAIMSQTLGRPAHAPMV